MDNDPEDLSPMLGCGLLIGSWVVIGLIGWAIWSVLR